MWCQCMTEGVRSPRPDDWLENPILLNLGALAASREECRPVGMVVTAPAWIVCIWGRSQGSRTNSQPFHFPIISHISTDQLFVEAAPPSLPPWSVQCRSGRSLCLPPLVKVGNTKTNSGDRRDRLEHMSSPLLHSTLLNTPAIKIPTPNADLAPN